MAHQDLTPRLRELVQFATDYALAEHTAIGPLLASINASNPSSLDVRLSVALERTVARFRAFHEVYPFVTAPQRILNVGGPSVLRQFANNAQIPFTPEELARGLLVIGSAGSGKTALLLQLAQANLALGFQEWIVDLKSDAQALALQQEDMLVVTSDAPLDLLARPPYLSRAEHLTLLVESLARTMYGGQTFKAVTHEVFTKTFSEHDQPTLRDVFQTAERLPQRGDTYDRLNALRNLGLRLQRLIDRYPGTSARGVPVYELCEHSVLFSLLTYTDVEDFLITLCVLHLFHHHRAKNIRSLRTTVHVDEALLAFRAEGNRINGNPLAELVGLTREFGIAWRLSVNAVTLIDPSVLANVFAIIALNVNSGTEANAVANTFHLTPAARLHYSYHLGPGQALVRLGGRWRNTMLATYPPLPFSKTVQAEDWHAATQRIARLRTTPSKHSAAREEDEGSGRPTPALAPSSSPPSRIAPAVEQASRKKISLNAHATMLLRDVADHPLTLSTPSYQRCKLRLSEGDRAKTLLTNIGFLESHRVRTGAGRGKTGSALRLTPAGWTWLGRTPSKGTRGGDSVQHAFFVHELARRIPHSTIETLSVDLVIPYNTADHANLLDAALSARTIALNNGDLIACEIECSRPETTGVRSAQRDVGFSLTVLAVFGDAEMLRDRLAPSDRLVVVDVLQLLDALRRVNA